MVCLVLKAHAVAGPVIENPEAVGSINLSELHFHAVVRITIPGEDVEAPAARSAQLLGNDLNLARPSLAGSAASQFCSHISL